jgi:hypothetical protein
LVLVTKNSFIEGIWYYLSRNRGLSGLVDLGLLLDFDLFPFFALHFSY